jgi:hypothetical protein
LAIPEVLAELLAGVMDFMLSYEELLTQFCEDNGMNPEEPVQFRRFLPGGYAPEWG